MEKPLSKIWLRARPEHPYASVLVRRVGFLEQSIYEERFRLSGYRESEIRLGIGYRDAFMKEPFTAIFLWTAIRRAEPPNLPGTVWTISGERAALQSLLKFGIPWLNRNSRPKVLVKTLEKHLKETNAPGDHHELGLLYYEMGQNKRACRHAEAWLEHITGSSWIKERARTRRQLKAMKCKCK